MCQSTAYIIKGDKEEEVMTDIATIIPEGTTLRLISLFGEEKKVEASIEQINLLGHKILLRPK
ncbi:MAG: CooT family nickel-binding protein [Deltaproteobacteria bacterium]|nr:CooT family nickel-binding protein [Deltaproteobacteria bacterium]